MKRSNRLALIVTVSVSAVLMAILFVGQGHTGQGNEAAVYLPVVQYPLVGETIRVSVASNGAEGNGNSEGRPAISADGRYVAFESEAGNLISDDTNGYRDIFVHDRQTGETARVSVASDGAEGNFSSWLPAISADGRYVSFKSWGNNLVTDDTNGTWDVFVHDRQTGETTRVSVASDGAEGNNLYGGRSAMSADGRYVTFTSDASNLVSGDSNGSSDVFVHDRHMGQTTRASLAFTGAEGNGDSYNPAISADGRYVAFESWANNLVSNDTNDTPDVFVRDRETGQTTRVSVASDGAEGNSYYDGRPSISADGRYVAFTSEADNLVIDDTNGDHDVFVHDRQTGETTRVSLTSHGGEGNGGSFWPTISADGRYVAFESWSYIFAGDDTNGYPDIFVHDRQTGETTRISVASDGTQGNAYSMQPAISAGGRYVAFGSLANNLVGDDTNGFFDLFVRDRGIFD